MNKRIFAFAGIALALSSGCSTLLGGNVTDRLLEVDEKVADEVTDFKARYCSLSPIEKQAIEPIANQATDPNKLRIICLSDIEI